MKSHVIVFLMDSQWLNSLFAENSDKTKKSLADYLGMEPPAVSKMLNGTRQIKTKEYFSIRTFFGLPVDGEHAMALRQHPLTQTASNHQNNYNFAEPNNTGGAWKTESDLIQTNNEAILYTKTMIVKNTDDYMMPDFKKEEAVLVNLEDRNPKETGIFVISDSINSMLRRCEVIEEDGRLQVKISANKTDFLPQILDMDDVHILGRVIGKAIIE